MQIIKNQLTTEKAGIPLTVEEYKNSKAKFFNGPGFSRIYFAPQSATVKLLSDKTKNDEEKIKETYKEIMSIMIVRDIAKVFNKKQYEGARTITNIDYRIFNLINNNITTKSIAKNLTVKFLLEPSSMSSYKIKTDLDKSKICDIIDSVGYNEIVKYCYSSTEYKSLKKYIQDFKTKSKNPNTKRMRFILDKTKQKTK